MSNPMTNYNERLDEVLDKFGWTCVADGGDGYGLQNEDISDTKQALTSLIKELVAEAKPNKLKESDYTLNMSVPHNPPSNTTRTNLYRKGYNDSLDQFEQNLLKALEEK